MKRTSCLPVVIAIFLMVFSTTVMAQQKYDLKLKRDRCHGFYRPLYVCLRPFAASDRQSPDAAELNFPSLLADTEYMRPRHMRC